MLCFDKARPRIGAFLYKYSSDHEPKFVYIIKASIFLSKMTISIAQTAH